MRAVAIIPARFASTRFPGKPLAPLLGRPMVAWVVAAAGRAARIDRVLVATDHEGIAAAAREAGAEVVMTSPACASGTDRVAEAAAGVAAEVVVNVQGDEPLLDPKELDALVAAFDGDPGLQMATLARPIADAEEFADPNVVKVVCALGGDALYFSRAPIPHARDGQAPDLGGGDGAGAGLPPGVPLAHLGIYAFRRAALLAFPGLPPGALEQLECLEQLRALEAGWRIRVVRARGQALGVDTPADLARAEVLLAERLGI
ncbi:MAG: 3-deoxy-manno-octulosonate cytidylyltransferase [Deferrisomatales bacterium]|nr:3-deoxy-manno-octulosonate cytidylyltransferase [Deferrisomatales bacterium]